MWIRKAVLGIWFEAGGYGGGQTASHTLQGEEEDEWKTLLFYYKKIEEKKTPTLALEEEGQAVPPNLATVTSAQLNQKAVQ